MIETIPTIFEVSPESMTALAANAGSFIASVWPIVLLSLGLVLGSWLVGIVIGIFADSIREDRRRDRELSIRIEKVLSETDRLLKD